MAWSITCLAASNKLENFCKFTNSCWWFCSCCASSRFCRSAFGDEDSIGAREVEGAAEAREPPPHWRNRLRFGGGGAFKVKFPKIKIRRGQIRLGSYSVWFKKFQNFKEKMGAKEGPFGFSKLAGLGPLGDGPVLCPWRNF